jgi:hypothetical protein
MINVIGASERESAKIRAILMEMPDWYQRAGRVSEIRITDDPEVRAQRALYSHGTRDVKVAPDVGLLLRRALFHEWAHAIDDWSEEFGNPHVFSATQEWLTIHKLQSAFEIPKYRTDMREHFADAVSLVLLDPGYRRSHPREWLFVTGIVFPWIQASMVSTGSQQAEIRTKES